MDSPILIAHRGYAKRYPENTLVSIEAALLAGVNCIEFDVQFTSDAVPVVLHDASLKRTTGVNKRIFTVDAASLSHIVVNEAKDHPKKFANVGIPTLDSVVRLLNQWPSAKAFVEIKQESIDKFGIERVVRSLLESCQPLLDRTVLIAYDALTLRCGRAMGFKSVGWILKKYDAAGLSMATELAPDYLICNYTKLPKTLDRLWPGPWQWAFYEVTQAKVAYELMDKGAKYIETMAVSELLKDLSHKKHACVVE